MRNTQSSDFMNRVSTLFNKKESFNKDKKVFLATYKALKINKYEGNLNTHVSAIDIMHQTQLTSINASLDRLISPYGLLNKYHHCYDLMDYKIVWPNGQVHKYLDKKLLESKK